jgi:hypothetical protein
MERTEESRRNIEWLKCTQCVDYFIEMYVMIFNATDKDWVRFALWPAQSDTLQKIGQERQAIVLKARQLGLSWLVLCYALHAMVFRPAATILIFSKRDEEAVELLRRIKGVYERLPAWMKPRAVADADHNWELSNGSSAKSFPTTGGRSYTGSLVIVDEADFVPDLDSLINAVKPTIDAGGQMVMISTVDKSQPESPFKRIYRAAKHGDTGWRSIFLPWHARPGRTPEWYEIQQRDIFARTGSSDDLYQEYPATDAEAMAPRELDKRIPAVWLTNVYVAAKPLSKEEIAAQKLPSLPNLEVYRLVEPKHRYVIGGDPAEGNPNSDPSALTVLDIDSGEEVAALAGRIEPSTFAAYADELAGYYNRAAIMFERNNHGHACIGWLRDNSKSRLLRGYDDKRGWLSNSLGKALMYSSMADAARDQQMTIHSFETYSQLASIEATSLRAPEGLHDDRADSVALANMGRLASFNKREDQETPPSSSGYV